MRRLELKSDSLSAIHKAQGTTSAAKGARERSRTCESGFVQDVLMSRSISTGSSYAVKHKDVRERSRTCESGFTLIEIMVVMLVIGIIMSMAALSINLNQSNILETEIRRMRSLISMAGEEVIIQGQEMSVEMHSNGYQFLHLLQSQEQWQWVPVTEDKLFRPRCFPPGVELKLELEGEPATLERMSCDLSPENLSLDELQNKEELEDTKSKLDEENENEIPRIFLLSSGEMTPFKVTLIWEDGEKVDLAGELTGELEILIADDEEEF